MTDLLLECFRTVILLGIVAFLIRAGRERFEQMDRKGWNFILSGFWLLLLGSLLDITDNFESLNRFVIVGDTEVEAFLEKFIGFLGGFLMLAVGLLRWVPDVRKLSAENVERKRAEEILHAANIQMERHVELILNAAGEGIYGLDIEGRTTFCNPAAAKMIGWNAEELIGKCQHDIIHHTKPDGGPYPWEESPIYESLKDGTVRQVADELFWKKDGASFPVEYISAPIREGGRLMGAVVVFRDITERMKIDRMKDDFVSMISHEIRTPLNATLGALGLLGDTRLDEEQRMLVATARDSGEVLLELINDILDFSKIEAGKLEIEITAFDLGGLLQGVLDLVSPRAQAKNIALTLEMDPKAPKALVGDPGRLRQILLNLMVNAVKFTNRGSITLKVFPVSGSAWENDGEKVPMRFEIIDTGIGIPVDKQSELFTKFSQADASHSRKFGGTGLGLAISQRLVELMDGEIGFHSVERVGSTFWVNLPLSKRKEEITREETVATSADLSKVALAINRESRRRILVAEDNTANQKVVKLMLEKIGFLVDIAANGLEVIESVGKRPYDIILMDISMPEINGLEATAVIRSLSDGLSRIPIIALTANAMRGDREKYIAAGMNEYVPKPIRVPDLLDVMLPLLPSEPASGAASAAAGGKGEGLGVGAAGDGIRPSDSGAYGIIDLQVLNRLAEETSLEVLPELIDSYLEDSTARVTRIADAVAGADYAALEMESHALSSSSGAFGAVRLQEKAKEAELACIAGEREKALELAQSLGDVANATLQALASQRAHLGR